MLAVSGLADSRRLADWHSFPHEVSAWKGVARSACGCVSVCGCAAEFDSVVEIVFFFSQISAAASAPEAAAEAVSEAEAESEVGAAGKHWHDFDGTLSQVPCPSRVQPP